MDDTWGANTGALLMRSMRMELARPRGDQVGERDGGGVVGVGVVVGEAQQRPPAALEEPDQLAVHQHDQRPGFAARPGRAVAVPERDGQARAAP